MDTGWNEKDNKLKEIKPDTRPWKKNRRRKDETVNKRLRAGHTILTHTYLMEGLTVPQVELCHGQHLLTDCVNLASLRPRFFESCNLKTLKQILERNEISSNTINFLKGSNVFNLV